MDELIPDLQAFQESSTFNALASHTEQFDVFSIMGVSTKELVHSSILATLMKPAPSHGMGTRFRDAFIASLCEAHCIGTRVPHAILQSTGAAHAKVNRELAHIDILIDFPSLRLVVAIENKIWASDQKDQVSRYQQTLRELYPHHHSVALVYLTPTGRESPTQDPDSDVPVYCFSYGKIAALLADQKQHASPAAAQFIEQFIAHIGKTMSGTTELKDLCWELFKQYEGAYEHLVKNIEYCRFRKLETVFDNIESRLLKDTFYEKWKGVMVLRPERRTDKGKHLFDLDIRLAHWPEGVWIKIYKHNWFGVFPFFSEEYLESCAARVGIFNRPAREVPDWNSLFYASNGFEIKDDRRIHSDENTLDDTAVNSALTKAWDYLNSVDEAFRMRIHTCGHASKRTEFDYRGTVSTGVIIDFPSGEAVIAATTIQAVQRQFRGKRVRGGFDMTNAPADGVGHFLRSLEPSLTPRHASFLCAILVHEGLATSDLEGNAVFIRFH